MYTLDPNSFQARFMTQGLSVALARCLEIIVGSFVLDVHTLILCLTDTLMWDGIDLSNEFSFLQNLVVSMVIVSRESAFVPM